MFHNTNYETSLSNQVVLPIYGKLLDHSGITDTSSAPLDLFSIKAGNYRDDFVYTLTF